MNTAIYVYQPTSLHISTCEGDLELCEMDGGTTPLQRGDTTTTIARGIYKIVSSQDVQITGDPSTFDTVVTANTKTNEPTTPPLAAQQFAPLNMAALQSFLAEPDAKGLESF